MFGKYGRVTMVRVIDPLLLVDIKSGFGRVTEIVLEYSLDWKLNKNVKVDRPDQLTNNCFGHANTPAPFLHIVLLPRILRIALIFGRTATVKYFRFCGGGFCLIIK